MNRPLRLLVRWRALPDLKSHFDLIAWLAERLPAQVLILTSRPIPWIEGDESIRVQRTSERSLLHPALIRMVGWRKPGRSFEPDLVLALDEAYCYPTYQLVRWAAKRNLSSIYLSCQNLDRPLPPPFNLMENQVLKNVTGGSFLNLDACERARKRGFGGVSRVIPLPVNLLDSPHSDAPHLSDSCPPGAPLKVGYAGRLVPEKGVDTLIEAAALTGDQIVVAGDGPERPRLERLARSKGVESEWLGPVSSEEMARIYSKMDVLVLPSVETPRWKEQFGRVLVEAMAAGIPVIGSNTGEIPKVIGDAGHLFKPGDPRSLANELRTLRLSPGRRESLARQGKERIREFFSLEKVGSQWIDLIRAVLAKESRTHE